MGEDLELEFGGNGGERGAGVGLREQGQAPHHVGRHFELPLVLLWGGHICFGAGQAIKICFSPVRGGRS